MPPEIGLKNQQHLPRWIELWAKMKKQHATMMIEWFAKCIFKMTLIQVSGSRGATRQGPGLLVSN
jgi:hypothetical protein